MSPERLFRSVAAADDSVDFGERAVLADALEDAGFPEAQDLQRLIARGREPYDGRETLGLLLQVYALWDQALHWAKSRYYEAFRTRLYHAKTDDPDAMEAIAEELERAEYPDSPNWREAIRQARAAKAKDKTNAHRQALKCLSRLRRKARIWLLRPNHGVSLEDWGR